MNEDLSSQLSSDEVERLHQKHSESLRRYLISVAGNLQDAEDCLQSTFTILQQKGASCAPAARRAWLFRVAYNEAMKQFRRQRTTNAEDSKQALESEESEFLTPQDQVIQSEELTQVRQALDELPQHLREVVNLRITEGLRFRDIAQTLGIPIGTALARMHTALKQLDIKLRK